MANLPALYDARAEITRERIKINDAVAEAGQLDLSEEQQAKFDKLGAELEKTVAAIGRHEQLEQEMQALTRRNNPRQAGTGGNGDGDQQQQPDKKDEPKFESFGQMLQCVAVAGKTGGARVDERLIEPTAAAASGLNESAGSDGGFLVGTEITTKLATDTFGAGQIAQRCDRTPIGPGNDSLTINGIDETSRVDGSQFGGIVVGWDSEVEEMTSSKPKFTQTKLKLHKMTGLCYATDDLLSDAVALESIIMKKFPLAFGFKLDNAIFRGSGADRPKGILQTGCKVRVNKESGQKATTIVAENIEKMYSRQRASGMATAAWFINQDCWPQIFQLYHAIGTGGVPMFIPAGGLNQTPFGTLLGRPIVPIEQASTVGTEGDITFCDFNQYQLIDKGGVESATSIHVRFVYNESVFRFVMRVDGSPLWAAPQTPAQGSNTVSPFITLQTRS
jgi:HK97 family phage major capsid protein